MLLALLKKTTESAKVLCISMGRINRGFYRFGGDNCRAQHHQPQADGSNRGILDECMLTTLFLV